MGFKFKLETHVIYVEGSSLCYTSKNPLAFVGKREEREEKELETKETIFLG